MQTSEEHTLIDEELRDLLLHRDAHFAGQFAVMEAYTKTDGKGTRFELSEIEAARALEEEAQQNLAPLIFSESDMLTIGKIRTLYLSLRELCEQKGPENLHPKLIAELILAEEEEEEAALQNVIQQGEKIVPELIKLACHEEFANPLYPGYGKAPLLAIRALGAIGDRRAVVPLFELIGHDEADMEEAALSALAALREDAKPLLLNLVEARPITRDTERAVIALTAFPKTSEIEAAFQGLLKEGNLPTTLTQYLRSAL